MESSLTKTAFALLFLFGIIYVRLQYLNLPMERDEGEYAYIAWRINEGTAPYLSGYTMKLPLVHLLYALAFKVFGTTAEAARLLLLGVNLTSAALLVAIAKRHANEHIALLSGGLFLLFSILPPLHGLAANAEHFVNLFVLAALAVFAVSQGRRSLLLSGLCLGLAVLCKQTALVFAALPLLILLPRPLRRLAGDAACLAIGIGLPCIVTALTAVAQGSAHAMFFWVARYPFAYASQIPLDEGLLHFCKVAVSILLTTGITPALLTAGGLLACVALHQGGAGRFALPFLACSCVAILPGLYFRPHYFILTIPPIALLAAIGLYHLYLTLPHKNLLVQIQSLLLCGLVCAAPATVNLMVFGGLSDSEFMQKLYGANPFHHSAEIATVIREHSTEDDPIAVIGSEPQLYFYSGRTAATRYLYMYPLAEDHPFRLAMQDEFVTEVTRSAPRLLVVVNYLGSWNAPPAATTGIARWANDYIAEHYEPIYSIDYASGETAQAGETAISFGEENNEILVMKRIRS